MTTIKIPSVARSLYTNNIAQRVATNFGWSLVSEAIGRGVFFITNIYLARTLGVSNFGLFTLAQTITFYFWLAVDLGTNMYGIREIAKHKENAEEIINPLLTLRIIAGLVVFTVYTTSLLFFDMTVEKKLVFAAAGLYLLAYSFYTDWVLKGLEKFKYTVYGNLISSIVFLAGVFLFVRQSDNVVLASLIWALSYFFGSIGLIVFISSKLEIRYKPSFDIKTWLTHLKESVHFTFSGSLMALYQYLPILLISIFYGSYEVGLFSAPYRIVITICSAGFLIPMSFYPVFSELYHTDRAQFHNTHTKMQLIMLVLGLPAAIIGAVFSDRIIEILLGSQYSASAGIFKILVWLVPLYFLRFSYGSLMGAVGKQFIYTPIAVIVISVLCAAFIFTHQYSAIGLSYLVLGSESLVVALLAFSFHKWV